MNRNEFYILNSIYNGSKGRSITKSDKWVTTAINKKELIQSLEVQGYIADNCLTSKALNELEKYRVNNAVILAAGASTRFIPLSLEQPKGLFEVKGERLIERQIQQLLDAGINDITLVLGYKKEMFYYLKEKYNVKFIENPLFNIRNNIESIYCAKEIIGSTYICVSDSYFIENPFNEFEFESFSAGQKTDKKTNEMYVYTDNNDRIISMHKDLEKGTIMLGHAFWNKEFSSTFLEIVEKDRTIGKYDNLFWEWLIMYNLEVLPEFYLKEYSDGNIFEFDYFEELREFDNQYLGYTHSEIIRNIKLIFRCEEEDIINFRNVSEGLTNTSFIFQIDGIDYIYRHPGDGTENIINRRHEKKSLVLAKQIGIDPTYIYADVNEGWKISVFIPEFREPSYESFDDSKKVISVLRKLHKSKVKVDYGMKPWDDAVGMEKLLTNSNSNAFDKYYELKSKIEIIYNKTLDDGIEKCFCHGDTYRPNWMIKPDGSVILIDWEYAGYSDPGVDVGYYIVDAMYDFEDAKRFIKEYLQNDYSEINEYHFLAYVAIIAYYWFVWALYRESCGAVIGEALESWHQMAEKYANYLLNNYEMD